MKHQLFILIFLVCQSLFSTAQITFQKLYVSSSLGTSPCNAVATTSDSGFIMAGNQVISGSTDAWITKTNGSGDVEWSTALGGSRPENIYSIKQIANGSYVIAGSSRSFSPDSIDQVYVLQLDASGNVEWEKTYGSSVGAYEAGAHRINQTSDGRFIIGGYEADLNVGMLYMKTDSSGNISWGKYISGSIGTYGVESIRQTTDGGYIITGNGGILIKTDASGNVTWSKSYINGAMSFSAQQTSDGGYMLAGETNLYGFGSFDMYLIKTDSSGNVLWSKTYGTPLSEELRYAHQTSDGGYILAGTSPTGAGDPDIYVVKTDSTGSPFWAKSFGGTSVDMVFGIEETSAGEFIIGGFSNSFGLLGVMMAYLIKTDANGTSGCYESSPITVVTSPAIVATTLNETATTFTPDTYIPASNVGGGLVESLLCLNNPSAFAEVDSKGNSLSIAPNPAADYVTIEFDRIISNGKIDIYNALGEMVLSDKINNETKKVINLINIPGGIYFLKVQDGQNNFCKKFIVEHD